MMLTLLEEMNKRESDGSPVKVAISGTGFIGRGLIIQLSFIKGMRLVAAANRTIHKAVAAIELMKGSPEKAVCVDAAELKKAISEKKIAVVSDPMLLLESGADILVDTTGDPIGGAMLAMGAIQCGMDFVANAEMDITFGSVMAAMAKEKKVVYSGAGGDEPGVILKLYNYVKFLGFDIIAAGKFKGFTDCFANPDSVMPWATGYNQSSVKIASFADGTKMSIEMGMVANALGFIPDIQGMHCPEAPLEAVKDILKLEKDGGILKKSGVVEVVKGAQPSGGVFVIAHTDHPQIISDMKYYKMGDGSYYLFYIPYHLCSGEMAEGLAEIALYRSPSNVSRLEPSANVFACAKKPLKPGDVLDGIGGFSFYGVLDRIEPIISQNLLPVGLAPGLKVTSRIQPGEAITLRDVEIDFTKFPYSLWQNCLSVAV